jgi:hypothetical protein
VTTSLTSDVVTVINNTGLLLVFYKEVIQQQSPAVTANTCISDNLLHPYLDQTVHWGKQHFPRDSRIEVMVDSGLFCSVTNPN